MFLDQFEGISPDVRTHLPNIKKMEIDTDDVIICAFAKSGIFINIIFVGVGVGWGRSHDRMRIELHDCMYAISVSHC